MKVSPLPCVGCPEELLLGLEGDVDAQGGEALVQPVHRPALAGGVETQRVLDTNY